MSYRKKSGKSAVSNCLTHLRKAMTVQIKDFHGAAVFNKTLSAHKFHK